MKFKKIIKKIFHSSTGESSQKPILKHWIYKLTIEDVSIIFESNDLSCFGLFFRGSKFNQFIKEYDSLFNKGASEKQFNANLFLMKMYVKQLKLRAMYDALINSDGVNSRAEYLEMFGKEFEGIEDIKRIVKENERLSDKIKIMSQNTPEKKESITFNQLVIVVESSRNIPINRKTKLYEFKKMYDIELEKWHKT